VTGRVQALRRGQAPTIAPRRPFGVARALGTFLLWTLTGLGAGLALALLLPFAFHARPLTVMSGSMEPAIHAGDVVVAREIEPLDARPGDIVTFRDHERDNVLVTHRVRSMRRKGDKVQFVTKGDANNSSEHWQVGVDGSIGRTLFRLPALGHVFAFGQTPTGILVLVLVPLLLLGTLEIASIWRSDDDAETTS
jgi:signal peptidase